MTSGQSIGTTPSGIASGSHCCRFGSKYAFCQTAIDPCAWPDWSWKWNGCVGSAASDNSGAGTPKRRVRWGSTDSNWFALSTALGDTAVDGALSAPMSWGMVRIGS